jgi:malonyl CoA-acyl carrier protein transacylase
MSLKVVMFPGQGSQYEGMGETLFQAYPEIVALATAILGFDIKRICLKNPNGDLTKTIYTQPALYLVSYLAYLDYLKENPAPDYVLGHSLGEFNALCAAGVVDFETGLRIVKKRAELMFSISETSMAAVIGATHEEIEEHLTARFPAIDIANINTPAQIVISGPVNDLANAATFFEDECLTYIPLNVSGAFHSRYMTPLKKEFEKVVSGQTLHAPKIPVVANFTAEFYPDDKQGICKNIVHQLDSSIRWLQSVELLLEKGRCTFSEVGPGQILSNMIKKIQPVSSGRN